MIDLSKTTKGKIDQIDAELAKEPFIIKISHLTENSDPQQPISIHWFNGDGIPFKPCLTMRRVLEKVWSKDGSTFKDRYIKLFNQKSVTFGKENTGGVRISHLSNIDKEITVRVKTKRGKYEDYSVKPLSALDILKCEGEISAKKGLAEYTAWGQKLSAEQKTSLGAEFIKEMTIVAKNFDAKGN